jgi:hypothetical protein
MATNPNYLGEGGRREETRCYNIYNDNPIKFLSFVGKSHNKFGLRQMDICNCKARKKEKDFQFEK